jgi:hypothetical protein
MATKTSVRVHKTYGLQHKHPGIGYWHMASKKHAEDLHGQANAAEAEGLTKLTAAQRKTYALALTGIMTPEAKAYYAHAADLARVRAAKEEGLEAEVAEEATRAAEAAELEELAWLDSVKA